jgi:hypothetical protein
MQKIMEKKTSHQDGPDAEKFGRKEAKYHPFVMGRKNKMVKGRSPSAQPFLIAFAHRPGRAPVKKKMICHQSRKAAKLHLPGQIQRLL